MMMTTMASSKNTNNTNPGSSADLVFDFPDQAPRFEFDDSPTRNIHSRGGGNYSSPVKTIKSTSSRRFGKFVSSKQKARTSTTNTAATTASGNEGGGGASASIDGGINGGCCDNHSGMTATTASLNHDSSLSSTSGDENSPTRRAKSSSNNNNNYNGDGDIAAGVPNHHFILDDSRPSPATKLNLLQPHALTISASRQSAASSSYATDVSEFSFDRVTVATNETGLSSNVSWSFFDDAVMQAAGAGQREYHPAVAAASKTTTSTTIASAAAGTRFSGSTPITASTNNRGVSSNSGKHDSTSIGKMMRMRMHRKKASTSTFDNVSASSDQNDEEDNRAGNVGANYSPQPCDQSVISEITERTGGGGGHSSGDEYPSSGSTEEEALLLKSMMSAQLKHHSLEASLENNNNNNHINDIKVNTKSARFKLARTVAASSSSSGVATTTKTTNTDHPPIESSSRDTPAEGTTDIHIAAAMKYKNNVIQNINNANDDEDDVNKDNNNKSSLKSKANSLISEFIEDISSSYNKFKASRTSTPTMMSAAAASSSSSSPPKNSSSDDNNNNNNNSILQSLIEDLHFCGLYLCGNLHDTTTSNDTTPATVGVVDDCCAPLSSYGEDRMKKKENRKKQADVTFLGKIVCCGRIEN